MRQQWLVCLVLIVFFSACATNPARRITPNDEEVQVLDGTVEVDRDGDGDLEKTDFVRGKMGLDEQEFYESIGDTDSYEKVKGSRTVGTVFEGVGFTAMIIGILAAAGGLAAYFLSDTSNEMKPIIPVPEDTRPYVMYGVYGSAGLAGLGGLLFFGMQGKARGDTRVFDLEHARKRLEVSLYGENGATPDDIKTLTFGKGQRGAKVCFGSGLTLDRLVALDARGRQMKVSDRADWFEWLTTPRPDLVERAPDAPLLHSPLGDDLKNIDDEITLSVKIPQTGVGHAMTFQNGFGCGGALGAKGSGGAYGRSGQSGSSGRSGFSSRMAESGGMGGDGGDGGPGGAGPTVRAEVAWVSTPKQGRLALIVVDGVGALFDPNETGFAVYADGGSGGSGGNGGRGGHGGDAASRTCMAGASGGSGGRGGRGGSGGPGGSVVVRAADEALLRAVRMSAEGGSGGSAGDGGSGGSAGSSGSCEKGFPPKGAGGPSGPHGSSGVSGPSGSTSGDVVPVSQLSSIARYVAAHPQLTLEGSDGAVPPSSKPKKRR
jgi:hypothetical protein